MKTFKSLPRAIISCAVAGLALAGFATTAAGKDLTSSDLPGTWNLVYQEHGGHKLPDENAAQMFHARMVFKDGEVRYTAELPGFDLKFSYVLNTGQQPAGIDLKLTQSSDGKDLGKMMLGICRLENDTLEICYHPTKRPTEFAAAAGSENVLIVLKKAPESQ